MRRALADGLGRPRCGRRPLVHPGRHARTARSSTRDGLRGILHVDAARRLVTALPGTTVAEFGDPLWAAGLALANQGDIDTQAIAGAIATGTHGSGNALPSFSATMRACRLVDGHGEVVEIDETPARPAARRPGRDRDARRHDERDDRGLPGLQAERAHRAPAVRRRAGRLGRALRRRTATSRSSGCRARPRPSSTGWRRRPGSG